MLSFVLFHVTTGLGTSPFQVKSKQDSHVVPWYKWWVQNTNTLYMFPINLWYCQSSSNSSCFMVKGIPVI